MSAGSMLLPSGFAALRPDAGSVLRSARRDARIKQQTLADVVGVARETLSRIETGRAAGSPGTLDALLAALELDWDAVAVRGPPPGGRARPFDGSWRGDALLDLGRDLRRRRRAVGLSLRAAGALVGISAAQLSRVERGQATRSRLVEDHPEDLALGSADRRVVASPRLNALLAAFG